MKVNNLKFFVEHDVEYEMKNQCPKCKEHLTQILETELEAVVKNANENGRGLYKKYMEAKRVSDEALDALKDAQEEYK